MSVAATVPHWQTASPDPRVSPVVSWALYGLAFSIPLEYPDRFAFEVSSITGSVFLLSTVLQFRESYGRIPWALACYALYLFVLLFALETQGTTYPGGLYLEEVAKLFLLILLWVLVFWACANLLENDRIARGALGALVIGCLIRAALPLAGLGRTARPEQAGERVSALGQQPGQSAQVLALGLLALIGLTYVQRQSAVRPRFLVWGAVWGAAALLAVGLVQTGSRGGLVILAVGLVVLLPSGRRLRLRVRNAIAALLALGLMFAVATRSDMMRSRLAKAEGGSLAQREKIYPLELQMIREKPLRGWGPITNKYELGLRLGDSIHMRRDAHNIVLEMMTATGLLGTIPFLIGVYLCVRSAWMARGGPRGVLPLATALAVLAGNMTENRLAGPLLWLVLAYALASGAAVRRRALVLEYLPASAGRFRSPPV